MKKRLFLYGLALSVVIALGGIFYLSRPEPSERLIRLVITGPEGQSFTGSYLADGKWHIVDAVVPADIRLHAKSVFYGFAREDGVDGPFSVTLYADGMRITSVTNEGGMGVRGQWVATVPEDRSSATAFADLQDLDLPNQPVEATADPPNS